VEPGAGVRSTLIAVISEAASITLLNQTRTVARFKNSDSDGSVSICAMTACAGNVTITNCPASKIPHRGRVAQLAEQLTLNQ
jgi:hypothetical protein